MSQDERSLPPSGGEEEVGRAERARQRFSERSRGDGGSPPTPRLDPDEEEERDDGDRGGGRLREILEGIRGKGMVVAIVAVVLILAFAAWWFLPALTGSAPAVQAPAPASVSTVQPVAKPAVQPKSPGPVSPVQPAGELRLPVLVTTKQAWQVPPNFPALASDLNKYGSWLGFFLLILTANWAFHRERQGKDEGDYQAVRTATILFWVLGVVFARGVAAALGDPLSWLAGQPINLFASVEYLVILLAVGVIVVGVVKAFDGVRDFTPLSAAMWFPGAVLAWTQPKGTLLSVGFLLMGLAAVVLFFEFVLKDPKTHQRRLWSPVAAAVGFAVFLLAQEGIAMALKAGIGALVFNASIPMLARQVLAWYVSPLVGVLATIAGIVLGGLLATRWAGVMIGLSEKLLPADALGGHDEFDALLAMVYIAAGWFIARGGF